MTAVSNGKKPDVTMERRKSKGPRRKLVDLTLAPGTNKRKVKEDRRKETDDSGDPSTSSGQAERQGNSER